MTLKMTPLDILLRFRRASKRLVLLDYDGTLVNLTKTPELASPTKLLIKILEKLHYKPNTNVTIITGRTSSEMDNFFKDLPLEIIAEHGATIREYGLWKNQIEENTFWKTEVLECLNRFTPICTGSFVEEKQFAIAWHYRNSEIGLERSRDLIIQLENLTSKYNLKILDGNRVIEVLSNKIGKGAAVKQLVDKNEYDFILAIGDDITDEEMFEELKDYNHSFTVKVGDGNTAAKYKLNSPVEVLNLLNQL